jgi:hypothetical protein
MYGRYIRDHKPTDEEEAEALKQFLPQPGGDETPRGCEAKLAPPLEKITEALIEHGDGHRSPPAANRLAIYNGAHLPCPGHSAHQFRRRTA